MKARFAALLVLLAGWSGGRAETAVTVRLQAELQEAYAFAPPVEGQERPAPDGEPLFKLEPMVVTVSPAFAVDILAEARRALAAKEALKFSLLKGGTIHSSRRGDLGFWPAIIPINQTPVKKGTVGISVDLLRINW